jgi:hypothetical protein
MWEFPTSLAHSHQLLVYSDDINLLTDNRYMNSKHRNSGISKKVDLSKHTIRIYKTIILLVVLYGCKTWSPTLREEHILRVFENRVLRKVFAPKRDEVTQSLRKLHNEELHNLCPSPSIFRTITSRRMG